MATYAELEKERIEQLAQQQIEQQKSNSMNVDKLSTTSNVPTQDLLATYDPSMQKAVKEGINYQNVIQQRNQQEILGLNKLKSMRNYYNQAFNYALDKYQNAGYTLQQSNEYAKLWAKQQADQEFQSEMGQKKMDYAKQQDAIRAKYQGMTDALDFDTGDPYTNAIIMSLFQDAGSAATYGISKNMNNQNNGNQTNSNVYNTGTDYGGSRNV